MGLLDKLNIGSGVEKPRRTRSSDKTKTWVKNFTDYLAEQKAALKSVDKNVDVSQKRGKGKRNKVHTFWSEEKDCFVFVPRYGTKLVALRKGDDGSVGNQLYAKSVEEMGSAIDVLIEATKLGEMNEALAEAAARPRKSSAGTQAGDQPPRTDAAPAAPLPTPATPAPATPASAPSGTSTRKNRS